MLTKPRIRYLTPLDILGDLGRTDASSTLTAALRLGLLSSLHLRQGRIALCTAKLWLLRGLLLDIVQTQSDHCALNLVRSCTALLEVGLRESLLVKTTPSLRPYELGGLFALESERLRLGRAEEDWLSVTTDKELASSGPDPVFGHGA